VQKHSIRSIYDIIRLAERVGDAVAVSIFNIGLQELVSRHIEEQQFKKQFARAQQGAIRRIPRLVTRRETTRDQAIEVLTVIGLTPNEARHAIGCRP
jgi:hypothetical protein